MDFPCAPVRIPGQNLPADQESEPRCRGARPSVPIPSQTTLTDREYEPRRGGSMLLVPIPGQNTPADQESEPSAMAHLPPVRIPAPKALTDQESEPRGGGSMLLVRILGQNTLTDQKSEPRRRCEAGTAQQRRGSHSHRHGTGAPTNNPQNKKPAERRVERSGSSGRTRTYNSAVNSRVLYH